MADAPGAADAPQGAPEASTRAIYATYGVGFSGNAVTMMLKVVVPLWAIQMNLTATEIGFAIGMSALLPFLLSIHGGVLMDKLGTRPVTLAYAVTTALVCPLYPVFPVFSALVLFQLITGLTSNMVWVGAQTLIVGFTKGQTTLLARFSVAARCGPLIAPVTIGVIWDLLGHWGAFMFLGAAGAFVVVVLFMVPATAEAVHRQARPRPALKDLIPNWRDYAAAFSLMAIPTVAFVVVMTALRISSTGIQTSFYVVYLNEIGFLGTLIGVLIGISEAAGLLGAVMAGWWEKSIKPHWVFLIFGAMSLFFVTITPALGGIFLLLAIATAGRGYAQGLSQPVMFGILARAVDPSLQGTSIGLRTTSNRLATVLVPLIMGIVADAVGIAYSFYLVGGTLIAGCLILALFVRRIPDFRT
ncbi:MAG: MFS transporter [Alphaproteobacteria bacterium]|nr:MFS transporter [Alphaproteobacteria bacterium]MCZ6848270.1 MFS transporter [Alphaproteobacteria bacterium]